jgi:hypothetical protein
VVEHATETLMAAHGTISIDSRGTNIERLVAEGRHQ